MTGRRNPKMWLAACWLMLALAGRAAADTYYVNPGESIQDAIDAANGGDEIRVSPGEYIEAIDFKGKAIRLYGTGGPGATTINGDGAYHVVQCVTNEGSGTKLEGFTITGGNASKGGGMYNSGGSSPTVSNCRFAQNTGEYGGGMYNGYGSHPTVSNCTFEENTAAYWGAGMFNKQSSPTVNNCTFFNNKAKWDGGGMFNDLSSPTVNNCSFTRNKAGHSGGGMYSGNDSSPVVNNCSFSRNRADASHSYGTTENMGGAGMYNQDSSPTVTNCIFSGNDVGGIYYGDGGGGMYNYNSSPKITDCTFEDNNAGLEGAIDIYGGAMYNNDSSPTVTNCTFSGNAADGTDPGDAMWNNDSSSPTLINCILWDVPWSGPPSEIAGPGTPTVTYCDVRGGWLGTGNINEEPLFETGTLRLSAGSPCIDAGNNDAVPSGVTTDLAGNPRFSDDPATPDTGSGTPPIVDMGAYEFQGAGPPPVKVPDVVGETQGQAEADILAADLTVGTITEAYSDTVPAGRVISQNPAAGTLVPKGTSVDLTVSLGPVGPPPPGLVAHWKLDESSGGTAYDSAGHNDGTLHGNPTWQPTGGIIDGALEFDGAGDYVDCGNSASLDITYEITVAAWVKSNDAGNSQHNPYVTKGDHSYGLKHFYRNSMEFFIYDGDWHAARFAVGDSFNGVWHHLAGTYDGFELKLYVDGEPKATTPHEGLIASSSFNVYLASNSEETDRYYEGLLDDVRIYEVALIQSEIQALIPGPPLVEVPDVVGETQAQAEADILAAGLTVGTITEVYSDTVPAGRVISQNPAAGTLVPKGTSVDLTVSLGPAGPPLVKVPDVVGETQNQAEADILAADLTVGTTTEVYSDTVPAGRVISQNPAAGALVPAGTSVDLTVSLGPAGPPPPGLVAHWKLDESSGDIAEDSAGDNDGILYGNPVWLPTGGMMDGALAFDGVGDYVSLPIGSVINSLTNSTFATWVDFANTGGPWQRIFDFGNNTITYMFLTPRRGTDGPMRFGITIEGGGAPEQLVTAPHTLASGWHHVAVTIDADINTVKLYLDGVVVATNIAVTLTPSDLGNTTRNWLGRSQYSADAYFDGCLDDFRIYDYALTQSEIRALIPGAPLVEVPDVVGEMRAQAEADILAADLTVGTITEVYSDTVPAGRVISQNPAAGTLVPKGTSVDLTVSLGPEGPGQPRACCFSDGSCQDLTAEECLAQGGTPQGAGTTCATTTCPAPGPVAHWKLDETQGTIAYDSAGTNDGVLYGNPAWLPDGGMVGGALVFDGLDDYVSLPIGSLIASLTDCTFATWVDFSNLGGPWQRIFDFGNNRTAYMFLTPRLDTDGPMRFGITIRGGGAPEQLVTAPHTLASGWHHVAVTIDADINTVKLYLDGVVVATNIAVTLTPSDLGNTTRNWLGRSQYSADAYFDGCLDDFRIYDYALSDEQIVKLLCIEPPPGDADGDCRFDFADVAILFSDWLSCTMTDCEESANPGLVAHYKLDAGSGTIASDASGNGHDGIAQNGEPNWVDGQTGYGKAIQWDGLTPGVGWIYCGTWDPSAVTGQLTVAAWAKWNGPNGAYQGLIGKRDGWDDQGTKMMWHMEINKNSSVVGFARAGVYPWCGDVVLPVGEWSHVAVTFDGATMVFYFDGAETGRDSFSFGSKTDATIVFGCVEASGWHGFNGALDDIQLYDYALRANEIYEIVQISCTDPPPGDVNNDCRFDFADLDILFANWLTCTLAVEQLCGRLTAPKPPVPPARSNWSPEWTSIRTR